MNNDELHVFDLDDTLLITPTFSELLKKDSKGIIDLEGEFSEFFKKIKSFFYIVFSKEIYFAATGDFVVIYDNKTKLPLSPEFLDYIQDIQPESMSNYGLKSSVLSDVLRALQIYEGHIVFRSIPKFHEKPETIGKIINNPVFESYKKASNKMILTGRNIAMKSLIEERLQDLGFELPNYGIYLYKGGSVSVQNYKIQTILDSINQYGWKEIHFYEDRKDWLEAAKDAVAKLYPDVMFHPHLIPSSKHVQGL